MDLGDLRQHFNAKGRPKRAYLTKEVATVAARAKGARYHAYECPSCHRWHVGSDHPPRSRKRRGRKRTQH